MPPRPKVRPTMGLHNLGRGVKTGNGYVTNCKLCPAGIYRDQPYRWLTAPMGLSHDRCAEQSGLL